MTKTLKELFEEIKTEQILKQQTIPTIISIKKWHREFQANKPHVKLVKDLSKITLDCIEKVMDKTNPKISNDSEKISSQSTSYTSLTYNC